MRARTKGPLLTVVLLAAAGAVAFATDEGSTRRDDGASPAGDTQQKAAPSVSPYMRAVSRKQAENGAERVVFSNDDLEQRYGPPPAQPDPANGEPHAASTEEGSAESNPEAGGATDDAEAQAGAQGAAGDSAAGEEPACSSEDGRCGSGAPADPLQLLADEKARAAERSGQLAAAERNVEQARERITNLERRLMALRNPLLARPAPPEEGREEWDRADATARVSRSQSELEQARAALATAEQELARLRAAP